MTKFVHWIFWLILLPLFIMGIFQWQKDSKSLFASTVRDIIYEGSGGEVRTSATDQEVPQIAGYTAEEKADRTLLTLINIILYTCGTVAAVMIIIGGVRYIVSLGNDDAMTSAKKTILWSVGGLGMTFLAWAIVLNVVRIGSIESRLDFSENPAGGACSPNVVLYCGGICCGCSSSDPDSPFGCDEGLQCGGPMDVVILEGINELRTHIKVCQPTPRE